MISSIRKLGGKAFWIVYTPLSAELWVKLNGNRKIDRVEELLGRFGTNLSTLEVGSAEGYITRKLATQGSIKDGIAYDILPLRLKRGYERAEREGVEDKVSFFLGDARHLPFRDNECDVVLLLDVIEHIPTKDGVIQSLKEAYRVSSKGLIVSVPHGWFYRIIDLDHLRLWITENNSWVYDPKRFQAALEDLGYEFERVSERSGTYLIRK